MKNYITRTLEEMGDYPYVWDVVQSSVSDSHLDEIENPE